MIKHVGRADGEREILEPAIVERLADDGIDVLAPAGRGESIVVVLSDDVGVDRGADRSVAPTRGETAAPLGGKIAAYDVEEAAPPCFESLPRLMFWVASAVNVKLPSRVLGSE